MKVVPYLFFEGRCEEAIEFYKTTLGATVNMLMRYKDSPDQSGCGDIPGDKIMHASITIGEDGVLMSDGRCDEPMKFEGFGMALHPANEEDAARYFNALLDGGTVVMPLTKTFFSAAFGMLKDRFGVHWMIVVPTPM